MSKSYEYGVTPETRLVEYCSRLDTLIHSIGEGQDQKLPVIASDYSLVTIRRSILDSPVVGELPCLVVQTPHVVLGAIATTISGNHQAEINLVVVDSDFRSEYSAGIEAFGSDSGFSEGSEFDEIASAILGAFRASLEEHRLEKMYSFMPPSDVVDTFDSVIADGYSNLTKSA